MKIATKALASIMIAAVLAMAASGAVGASSPTSTSTRGDKKLSRSVQKHDRKMELRAATLGMSVDELKTELENKSFEQILKQHGFKSERAFEVAMLGKTKDELRRRGWSDEKISEIVEKRVERLNS